MGKNGFSGIQRILAGFFAAVLLAVVLFSAFYIIAEADHDCAGEDCHICACLLLCEHLLHRQNSGILASALAVAAAVLLICLALSSAPGFALETPVSKKVRLNN